MQEQKPDPHLDALRQALENMRAAARDLKNNLEGGRAFASTPEGRTQMMETRAYLAEWRKLLSATVRELAEADRVLDKTLRKPWGLRL